MFGYETAEFYFGYETNNLFRGTKQQINFRVRNSNSYETAEHILGTKRFGYEAAESETVRLRVMTAMTGPPMTVLYFYPHD